MDSINGLIYISDDNSKMKSKKNKEEQVICGKKVIDIVTSAVLERGVLLNKDEIVEDLKQLIVFAANGAFINIEFVLTEIKQYKTEIILFKDINENEFALYIPEKIIEENINIIKSSWISMQTLSEKLGDVIRVIDVNEVVCVESKLDLSIVTQNIQYEINLNIVNEGTTLIDFDATYIDFDVKIGVDTIIYPNTFLKGNTIIGEDCIIGPDSRIQNSIIGNNTNVKDSTIVDSKVENNTNVGPYAYIRPNSKIGSEVKIGDFVEIKNSTIGDGTKISHLSYVGDADLGENVNIGCGVVFVNYNGKDKSRSVINDNVFIGCNSNIVAPIELEEYSYVAAGTTVTRSVPSGALAVGRARQQNKEGWVAKRNLIKKK